MISLLKCDPYYIRYPVQFTYLESIVTSDIQCYWDSIHFLKLDHRGHHEKNHYSHYLCESKHVLFAGRNRTSMKSVSFIFVKNPEHKPYRSCYFPKRWSFYWYLSSQDGLRHIYSVLTYFTIITVLTNTSKA